MNYAAHHRKRYLPTAEEARSFGLSDFAAIRCAFPPAGQNPRILDIGCGSGNLLFHLKELGYGQCRGVEMSCDLAGHARSILGLDVVQTDWLGYLKETEDQFDLIVALDVVEHLRPEDCIAILTVTRTRLRKGGRLILRTPNAECPFVLPTYCGDLTHRTLFSPRLLEHTLRQAGFSGSITFAETRPFRLVARLLYNVVHHLLVRPLLGAFHYHFYRQFPRVTTRNLYCVAAADNG